MGGLFALLAAFGFTLDNILVRKGLMEENHGNIWDIRLINSVTSLSFFLVGVCIATLFGFNIILEFKYLSYATVLILIVAGVLGHLIGALLLHTAIGQIGSSHASALWGGSNPLFATLFAVVFLGELPDLIGIFSVLMIVGGIVVVGYHGHEGNIMLLEKTKLAGGIIAMLSGICIALAQIGRGTALNLGATPVSAYFVLQVTALIISAVVCFRNSGDFKYLTQISRKSLYCYATAGLGTFVGNFCVLFAFTMIPVWQAVAIRNVQPILVVFFSWIFLKQADKINFRLVLGATLVTLGVVILNVY